MASERTRRGRVDPPFVVAPRRPQDMRDIPLLILTLAVSGYWVGVARMVIRVQHKTRRGVGLVPEQARERLMWLVWVPLVVAWIALPWIALNRTEALMGGSCDDRTRVRRTALVRRRREPWGASC